VVLGLLQSHDARAGLLVCSIIFAKYVVFIAFSYVAKLSSGHVFEEILSVLSSQLRRLRFVEVMSLLPQVF
jgi:hypothetical protein